MARAGHLCLTATITLNSRGMLCIYTSTSLLGPRQCLEAVDIHDLLDLVFANFTDLKSVPVDCGLVRSPFFEYSCLFASC
jgi:hypothetical protein